MEEQGYYQPRTRILIALFRGILGLFDEVDIPYFSAILERRLPEVSSSRA